MATFTSVGDNVVLDVSVASNLLVEISGTYNMVIALQREVGSPGSGVWSAIKEWVTANATVSESFAYAQAARERFRLIVTEDTSGTATATLTSTAAAIVSAEGTWGNITGTLSNQADLQAALDEKTDEAGAQAAAQAYIESLSGVQDATTALLGNQTWGLLNPAQVSSGEITAGTEAELRSYSPADIKSFATQHGGSGGGGLTLTNDANASVTVGNALTGTHRRLTHATPALTLDAQASSGTLVAATPAGGTSASVAVEAGATYFTAASDQSAAGATTSFNIKGFTVFECQANADDNSAKWFVSGDTDIDETTDGDLTVAGTLTVTGATDLAGGFDPGTGATQDLDMNGKEVLDAISPFQTMTGSQASSASGRSWKITGNATAVPITNGWWAKVVNTSGSSKTITPTSGSCVLTKSATTQATATLGDDKSCVIHGDGTNLIVDGDVS